MLINLTNHPSSKWSKEQKEAANTIGGGEIVDVAFPNVPATASSDEVNCMARELVFAKLDGATDVLIQGEMSLTFAIVSLLKEFGCHCYVACSDRVSSDVVQEDGTTKKISVFKFIQFREY